ncbi:MAG: hypothetical protein ACR2P1_23555 [Pseudomonadales bacterium]
MVRITRLTAALILVSFIWGCSDNDDEGLLEPGLELQLAKLSASLGSAEHSVNDDLLRKLLNNELDSEPFYLADYVRLAEHESAASELDFYISEEATLLKLVGAQLVLDNVIFNHVTSDDNIPWDRHRVIYFPNPQAFTDLITHPSYADLMATKHGAAGEIRGLWLNVRLSREAIEDDANKAEFYMLNLSKHREMALYPDGTSRGLTGEEANGIYGTVMLTQVLPSIGAYPVLAGDVTQHYMGADGDWETYATVRYPSNADLVMMTTSDAFQAIFPNKGAGLEKNISMMSHSTLDPPIILIG